MGGSLWIHLARLAGSLGLLLVLATRGNICPWPAPPTNPRNAESCPDPVGEFSATCDRATAEAADDLVAAAFASAQRAAAERPTADCAPAATANPGTDSRPAPARPKLPPLTLQSTLPDAVPPRWSHERGPNLVRAPDERSPAAVVAAADGPSSSAAAAPHPPSILLARAERRTRFVPQISRLRLANCLLTCVSETGPPEITHTAR